MSGKCERFTVVTKKQIKNKLKHKENTHCTILLFTRLLVIVVLLFSDLGVGVTNCMLSLPYSLFTRLYFL